MIWLRPDRTGGLLGSGNLQPAKRAYWLIAGLVIAFLDFGSLAVCAEKGMAAHYSDAFQGKRTAKGSIFDQEGLTAATTKSMHSGPK